MSIRQPKTSYEEARAKARAVRGQRPIGNPPPDSPGIVVPQPVISEQAAPPPLDKSHLSDAVSVIAPQADAPVDYTVQPTAAARVRPVVAPSAEVVADTSAAQAPTPRSAARPQHSSTHIGGRVRLAIIVRYPQPGHSKTFDQIAATYDPHRAMRQITKLALDQLEANPQFSRTNTPSTYPTDDGQLVTSRTVDEAFFNAARKVFDPLNLESTLAVSNFIVGVALAAFFENDRAS